MAFFRPTDKRAVKFIDDELEQSMDEIGCPVDFTLHQPLTKLGVKMRIGRVLKSFVEDNTGQILLHFRLVELVVT